MWMQIENRAKIQVILPFGLGEGWDTSAAYVKGTRNTE